MIYKIRVILDTKEDVFRDIEVRDKQTLFSLYKGIVSAFSLQGEELASFYISDKEWGQGKEIPLEDMGDTGNDETMADFYINEILPAVGDRLLFVYDYLEMWTFYVEVIAIEDKKAVLNYPLTVNRVGSMPLKAPKRNLEILDMEEDGMIDNDNSEDEDPSFEDLDLEMDAEMDEEYD